MYSNHPVIRNRVFLSWVIKIKSRIPCLSTHLIPNSLFYRPPDTLYSTVLYKCHNHKALCMSGRLSSDGTRACAPYVIYEAVHRTYSNHRVYSINKDTLCDRCLSVDLLYGNLYVVSVLLQIGVQQSDFAKTEACRYCSQNSNTSSCVHGNGRKWR